MLGSVFRLLYGPNDTFRTRYVEQGRMERVVLLAVVLVHHAGLDTFMRRNIPMCSQ